MGAEPALSQWRTRPETNALEAGCAMWFSWRGIDMHCCDWWRAHREHTLEGKGEYSHA